MPPKKEPVLERIRSLLEEMNTLDTFSALALTKKVKTAPVVIEVLKDLNVIKDCETAWSNPDNLSSNEVVRYTFAQKNHIKFSQKVKHIEITDELVEEIYQAVGQKRSSNTKKKNKSKFYY